MSTITADASRAPAFPGPVGHPGPAAQAHQGRVQRGRTPLAVPGRNAPGSDVVYKIASRREEFHAALGLVYRAYLRAGLCPPNPYRMRVTRFHLLPTTEVFVAVKNGEVLSTVSLVRDGELGLPMEAVYAPEIARLRKHGYSLAEVSCLADYQQGQRRSAPIVMRLMSFTVQCARYRGVDELLIAVHPRHGKFYQRFLGFRQVAEEKAYQAVCGKPAIAMALDLNWAPIDHPRLYAKFFGTPFPNEAFQERPVSDELRSGLSLVASANRVGCPRPEPEVLAPC